MNLIVTPFLIIAVNVLLSDEDLDVKSCDTLPVNQAFIVYWSSLLILLKHCFYCPRPASIKRITVKGSCLIIHMICSKFHECTWKLQPDVERYTLGNLTLAASVLFSANTYQRLFNYFAIANIKWISKTSYYSIQKRFLSGVINSSYIKATSQLIESIKEKGPCKLSGDGRCDSPGHNAKYMTYSLMDQNTNEIISMSITQVTEAGNSNRMEKMGFLKALNNVKEQGISVEMLTTDRHKQVRKHLRENEEGIEHQFDVWHFSKNIKSKLLAASKKSSCKELKDWIKSICNHLWWSCATCQSDEELLREKWLSVLHHIQNKHEWTTGNQFRRCQHAKLSKRETRRKNWLKADSDAF